MYQQAIKDSIKDWVGPGYLGSFYDAYDADARKLFWKQMQDHYYPLGIDAGGWMPVNRIYATVRICNTARTFAARRHSAPLPSSSMHTH